MKFFDPTTTEASAGPGVRSAGKREGDDDGAPRRPAANAAVARPRFQEPLEPAPGSPSAASARAAAGTAPARIVGVSTIDRPRKMYSPSPPAPTAAAIVAVPTPMTVATRMPAMIDGRASGSSTSRQQLPSRHPHRDAGFDDGRVDLPDSGHGRAHDGQQRVDQECDQRRARADAADDRQRQQKSEQREARDGLRDARDSEQRSPETRLPRGDECRRARQSQPRQPSRQDHEHDVLLEKREQLGPVRPARSGRAPSRARRWRRRQRVDERAHACVG